MINLAAPFIPFLTEEIYQNLVRRPFGDQRGESVHLCDFLASDEDVIDRKLSEEMALVRNIVSLGQGLAVIDAEARLESVFGPIQKAGFWLLQE